MIDGAIDGHIDYQIDIEGIGGNVRPFPPRDNLILNNGLSGVRVYNNDGTDYGMGSLATTFDVENNSYRVKGRWTTKTDSTYALFNIGSSTNRVFGCFVTSGKIGFWVGGTNRVTNYSAIEDELITIDGLWDHTTGIFSCTVNGFEYDFVPFAPTTTPSNVLNFSSLDFATYNGNGLIEYIELSYLNGAPIERFGFVNSKSGDTTFTGSAGTVVSLTDGAPVGTNFDYFISVDKNDPTKYVKLSGGSAFGGGATSIFPNASGSADINAATTWTTTTEFTEANFLLEDDNSQVFISENLRGCLVYDTPQTADEITQIRASFGD